ncbi:MAG TPA: energy transducer TonB [Mucilaginibacter sp.]|nr:energy transducer TonB [Mucilaginibacter sp.]
MKKTLSIILFTCAGIAAQAQQSTSIKTSPSDKDIVIDAPVADSSAHNDKIFTAVENEPTFPGGKNAFVRFLATNIRYPATAYEKHIQGKVFLSFVIEKDGSLTDIKVVRSASNDLDAEALRVMKICPRWNAGTQNGRPVRVAYTIPISFTLQ